MLRLTDDLFQLKSKTSPTKGKILREIKLIHNVNEVVVKVMNDAECKGIPQNRETISPQRQNIVR